MLTLGLVRQLHGRARVIVGLLPETVAHQSAAAAAAALGPRPSSCSRSISGNTGPDSSLTTSSDSTSGSSSSSGTSIASTSSSSSSNCTGSGSTLSPVAGRRSAAPPPAASSKQSRRFDSWPSSYDDRSAYPRNRQAQLTNRIKETRMPEQLLALLQQHSAAIDHINLGAAFTHARNRLCRTGMLPEQQPAAVQQLLQHLHQLAAELQQQCSARSLANIMSACGHLCEKSTVLLLLPKFLQDSKLQQATPQEVSNVLWSVSTLGMQLAEDQLQQLVQHFLKVLRRANPQDVANTFWSVARMGHTLPAHQLRELLQHLQQLLPQLQPADVAGTLVACASMQYVPLPLLSALEQQPPTGPPLVYAVVAAAKPQSLANMARACGQLGYSSELLPGAVLQQAALLLQVLLLENTTKHVMVDFDMQGLCNLCWTAAVLDLQDFVPQVLKLASGCAHAELWATATEVELCQLYQVHLWLQDNKLSAAGRGLVGPQLLSKKQLQQCKRSWQQEVTTRTASAKASDLQRSVFAALQALPGDILQQPPVLEQRTADGALSIDIAATTRSGVQLAIEVDGSSQLVQPACTHNGPTLFRNRALAARGYVVVSIPHWMWRSWRDTAQQQQYLLSKLQKAEEMALLQPAQHPVSR